MLNPEELQRYARQILLPEIGIAGQLRIQAARVLCVGAGGLGSPAALYLAAAGIGRLGLVDSDVVDLTNLHRQVLHATSRVGQPKTASAQETLRGLNPEVELVLHQTRFNRDNALELVRLYDLVLDGSDNLPTRYLVNDACVFLKKPLLYGAVFQFEGQASVLAPHLGAPCYRCLFPEPPPPEAAPSCAEAGVLGVVPGLIGIVQATEALKLSAGFGQPLLGRLLLVDALALAFREIRIRRDPGCPVCGDQPSIRELSEYAPACASDHNRSLPAPGPDEITVHELKQVLAERDSRIRVLDVREPHEREQTAIPGTESFPLSTLKDRMAELDPGQSYYLHCQVGVRSLHALELLRQRGFQHLKSVRGGMEAWKREIQA
jgi:sulfur-carrier protein adenylyltransferase/sulfurtransferase